MFFFKGIFDDYDSQMLFLYGIFTIYIYFPINSIILCMETFHGISLKPPVGSHETPWDLDRKLTPWTPLGRPQPRRRLVLGSWGKPGVSGVMCNVKTWTAGVCVCLRFSDGQLDLMLIDFYIFLGMGFKFRDALNKFFEMGSFYSEKVKDSSSATAPPACLAKPGLLKWPMKKT